MTPKQVDTLPEFSAMLRAALGDELAPEATTFVEMMAENSVMKFPYAPPGGISRLDGRAAIARYIADLGVDIESMSAPRIHRSRENGVVVLEFSGVGRSIANGKTYQQNYISVITLRDGHIAHYRDYWNPLVILDAMGATISMPEAP